MIVPLSVTDEAWPAKLPSGQKLEVTRKESLGAHTLSNGWLAEARLRIAHSSNVQ